jgi:hypothetical protein
MTRTTILLPGDLKQCAVSEARRLHVSFADFVRQAIREKLPPRARGKERLEQRRQDPLFRLADRLPPAKGGSVTDVAANHDAYLYGPKSESAPG